MKKIRFIAFAAVAMSVLCLAGCSKGKKTEAPKSDSEALIDELSNLSEEDWGNMFEGLLSESTTQAELQPTISIAFGDYAAMSDFASNCQNNRYAEGQEVTIDGKLSKGFASASIGESNGDGMTIGTTLEVEGWSLDDFPEDGSRVKVNAKVKLNPDWFALYLTAKPSDLTVISGPEY